MSASSSVGARRVAARDRREVVVANLDRDRAREQAALAKPSRVVRPPFRRSLRASAAMSVRSSAYVHSLDDDFDGRLGSTGRSSSPAASCCSHSVMLPTAARSTSGSRGAHVHEPGDAVLAQPRRRHGPDAPERVHGQLLKERLDTFGRNHGEAVRLSPGGGDLREKLVRRDARRRRESRLLEDPAPSRASRR